MTDEGPALLEGAAEIPRRRRGLDLLIAVWITVGWAGYAVALLLHLFRVI